MTKTDGPKGDTNERTLWPYLQEGHTGTSLKLDGSEKGSGVSAAPEATIRNIPSMVMFDLHGTSDEKRGRLGGSVGCASDFSSGHVLTVREFKPRVWLAAVSAEPASDLLSASLCPSPAHARVCERALSLSLSRMNKH